MVLWCFMAALKNEANSRYGCKEQWKTTECFHHVAAARIKAEEDTLDALGTTSCHHDSPEHEDSFVPEHAVIKPLTKDFETTRGFQHWF